ncbi:MAG: exodeoxyribonuclease III [Betaproteobacteria bacterium]|nr:exodeoxyribonuclease III [Betaproteobacteria bacterium]
MFRILTLNLNGIRSAWKKGFPAWLAAQDADVVCLQEVRAQEEDLAPSMQAPEGFHAFYRCASMKRGYSGVALWCRQAPERIVTAMNVPEFDTEGRFLRIDFPSAAGGFSVISLYLPSGSSAPERQEAKFRFMDAFYPQLCALAQEARAGREIVICGDWNIAHREIDLKNWKSNQKNSGFLPEERDWMTRVLDEAGWVDVYRRLYPEATGEGYTWWSNRGQAWAKNVGWRIDYQLATPGLAAAARAASVYREERFSDHAPLVIDYEWPHRD